jgi:hypothetical protein
MKHFLGDHLLLLAQVIVPWRPALEQHPGRHVSGVVTPGGGMDWSFRTKRGLGL